MAKKGEITEQEIEDALDFVAGLIDRHGDAYWPIFERLEKELEQRRSRAARLEARLKRNRSTDRSSKPDAKS